MGEGEAPSTPVEGRPPKRKPLLGACGRGEKPRVCGWNAPSRSGLTGIGTYSRMTPPNSPFQHKAAGQVWLCVLPPSIHHTEQHTVTSEIIDGRPTPNSFIQREAVGQGCLAPPKGQSLGVTTLAVVCLFSHASAGMLHTSKRPPSRSGRETAPANHQAARGMHWAPRAKGSIAVRTV